MGVKMDQYISLWLALRDIDIEKKKIRNRAKLIAIDKDMNNNQFVNNRGKQSMIP